MANKRREVPSEPNFLFFEPFIPGSSRQFYGEDCTEIVTRGWGGKLWDENPCVNNYEMKVFGPADTTTTAPETEFVNLVEEDPEVEFVVETETSLQGSPTTKKKAGSSSNKSCFFLKRSVTLCLIDNVHDVQGNSMAIEKIDHHKTEHIPKHFAMRTGLYGRHCKMILKRGRDSCLVSLLVRANRSRAVSWAKVVRESRLKRGDELRFKLVDGGSMNVLKFKGTGKKKRCATAAK